MFGNICCLLIVVVAVVGMRISRPNSSSKKVDILTNSKYLLKRIMNKWHEKRNKIEIAIENGTVSCAFFLLVFFSLVLDFRDLTILT